MSSQIQFFIYLAIHFGFLLSASVPASVKASSSAVPVSAKASTASNEDNNLAPKTQSNSVKVSDTVENVNHEYHKNHNHHKNPKIPGVTKVTHCGKTICTRITEFRISENSTLNCFAKHLPIIYEVLPGGDQIEAFLPERKSWEVYGNNEVLDEQHTYSFCKKVKRLSKIMKLINYIILNIN